jgi:quercetin dioxygenase-like cupin family protein
MITMINTIQENEIFNLADKVDYREGTFHPQAALRNDKAELFLMAVDAGVLIPDHKAPSDLIFQALEGEAVLHVGGKDLNVKKGDFLYLKEGTLHHLQAVSKFKFSMVRIYK